MALLRLRLCGASAIGSSVFAQTFEAKLHFASEAKEGFLREDALHTTGVTVTVRDVQAENADHKEAAADALLLPARGFAVLQPAFPGSHFTQQQFEAGLSQEDAASSLRMFLEHPSGLPRLGFDWVTCSAPATQWVAANGAPATPEAASRATSRSPRGEVSVDGAGRVVERDFPSETGPLATVFRALLFWLPSCVRVLKVWAPVLSPVQPLAVLDASTWDPAEPSLRHRPGQRWWWDSGLGPGDVLVLDALRCPHGSFALPGEDSLATAQDAVRGMLESLLPGKGAAANQEALEAALRAAVSRCDDLSTAVLQPQQYPQVGERYVVHGEPTTLVRRQESVESDVIADIYPGGVVTVLEVGLEGSTRSRARVYTEQAIPVSLGAISDSEGGAPPPIEQQQQGMIGWISSAGYDGARVLQPLSAPLLRDTPPPALLGLLDEAGRVLGGVCAWANVTLEALDHGGGDLGRKAGWHAARILDRHVKELQTQLEGGHRVSVQAHCIAIAAPSSEQLHGVILALAFALLGFLVLRRLGQ